MQLENRLAVPIELPKVDVPIFRPLGTTQSMAQHTIESPRHSTRIPFATPSGRLQAQGSSPQLQLPGDSNTTGSRSLLASIDQSQRLSPMELSQQSLERAGLYFSGPCSVLREEPMDTMSVTSHDNSTPTLVGSQTASHEDGRTEIINAKPSDQEMVEQMMKSAFLRTVLCWIFAFTTTVFTSYRRMFGPDHKQKVL